MTIPGLPAPQEPIELKPYEKQLLELARLVAEDSPDRSRKVGAILINANFHIIAGTCNTLPLGVPHEDQYLERPAKYDWTEHAERNAIFEAARTGQATEGCAMVLPWFPCMPCARAIVQSGIKRVVAQYPDLSDPTWGKDFIAALELFKKAGVQYDSFVDHVPVAKARAEGDHAPMVRRASHEESLSAKISQWNEEAAQGRFSMQTLVTKKKKTGMVP